VAGRPWNGPSPYRHRPELHGLYRSWRRLLDSYPAQGMPGARTAIGEVWCDAPATLEPYLAPGGLPQVFNFELVLARWQPAARRAAVDGVLALASGSRAPWVIGNHDVPRAASRYRLDEGYTPARTAAELIAAGDRNAGRGARRARAAALLLLALPGSAYIYAGDELGLPEVTSLPDEARTDPRFSRSHGRLPGRDGCRVPLPWTRTGRGFGFSAGADPAPSWLPQPPDWGRHSVEAQLDDEGSFLRLYQAALRLRRDHPALGRGELSWRGEPETAGLLCFDREPGFTFAANLGPVPLPVPPHRQLLLASGPVPDGSLAPDTAVWLAA